MYDRNMAPCMLDTGGANGLVDSVASGRIARSLSVSILLSRMTQNDACRVIGANIPLLVLVFFYFSRIFFYSFRQGVLSVFSPSLEASISGKYCRSIPQGPNQGAREK